MKILLTGASGFVGKNFLKRTTEYEIVPVSLKQNPILNIDFSGIDVVLHLAGLAHQMKGAPAEEYYKINTDLTFNFAKKAKENGVMFFIFMSTVKVYGESTEYGIPFNEQSICNPRDPYSKSKLLAEEKLKTLADENFKVAIVRTPLIYGAGAKGNLKSLMNLVEKFPIIPLGGIQNKRSLIYIGNLIELLKRIIEERTSGIFLACDFTTSTSELLLLIANAFSKKIILVKIPHFIKKSVEFLKPGIIQRLYGSFELDSGYTNHQLKYSPKYSIEQGIQEMVQWYIKDKKQKVK